MPLRFPSLLCGLAVLSSVFAALPPRAAVGAGAARVVHAQPMRAADPAPLGQTVHFTLDKDEQKDLAITLAPGQYVITADVKSTDDKATTLFTQIDLLKTNGALVESGIVAAQPHGVAYRLGGAFTVGKPYTAAKPLAARLRVKGQSEARDYRVTVQPVAKRTFIPFGFKDAELKPLALGTENGKGGTLDEDGWAFHKITLPPGKYNVSLYLKASDGKQTTLMGGLTLLDQYGMVSEKPSLDFYVQEHDVETRKEGKLLLLKPQTFLFRVDNPSGSPEQYTVGVEKDTD